MIPNQNLFSEAALSMLHPFFAPDSNSDHLFQRAGRGPLSAVSNVHHYYTSFPNFSA